MSTWTAPALPVGMPAGGSGAFVGRFHELSELEAIWSAVVAGGRQAVFVGGEPGIGKTRLVSEAAAALHRDGALVLWGACYPDLDVPYRPFVTALEQLVAANGEQLRPLLGESAARLHRLVPSIAALRPARSAPDETDGDHSRLGLFGAVADLATALAEHQPVVLVLEDLHWAAAPTLALVAHLVRTTPRVRLLVLATHRSSPLDGSDELTAVIADLYRHEGVTRLDLAGLETAAIAAYLRREAGMSVSAARRSAVLLRDQTGGNPFFLLELWRDLAKQGGVASLRRPGFQAPRSVRDTLDRRLAELPAAHAEVVELAAVAGDVVDLAVLLVASNHAEDVALAAVDAAVALGWLAPDPSSPDRYRFQHALLRQAVLDRLPPSRRAAEHARIAEALESQPDGTDPGVVAQLAHHHAGAQALGHADQAVSYLVRAAEHAERSAAPEDAAALYARAAQLPARAGPSRSELWFAAATNLRLAGDFTAAREHYGRLARGEDAALALQAAIGYEDASWRPGVYGAGAVELLQETLRRWSGGPDDALRIEALASLGRALSFTGDVEASHELGERALRLARQRGDDRLIAHALSATLWQGMAPSLAPELLARATELSGLARRLGDDELLCPGGFYRSLFGYLEGLPTEWAAAHDDCVRAARSGQRFARYMAGCVEYARSYCHGAFAAAAHTLVALDELGSEFGPDTTEGSYGIQRFMLERATGGLERVRPLLTGAEDLATHWPPGLLALYRELGWRDPGARVLDHLLGHLDAARGRRPVWPAVLVFLVDAVTWLGDRAAADRLRPYVAEYEGRNLVAGQFVAVFGSADRYLARLDALLGRPSADLHFERALDLDRRMRAVTHQAETLAAWAAHACRSPDPRVARRGERLRAEAAALAGRIGHHQVVGELTTQGVGAGLRPAGLTEREVEVLRLVAAGRSNRQIGEQLFISQNTAANHVRSILTKTGATNRTGAAMYAAEHRLLVDEGPSPTPPAGLQRRERPGR